MNQTNNTGSIYVFFLNHLRPERSMSLIATAIAGNITKVVNALISRDDEEELIPKFDSRIPTPACSRI